MKIPYQASKQGSCFGTFACESDRVDQDAPCMELNKCCCGYVRSRHEQTWQKRLSIAKMAEELIFVNSISHQIPSL